MIVYTIEISERQYENIVSRVSNVFTSKEEAKKCFEAYVKEIEARFHKIHKRAKQGGCCDNMNGVWSVEFQTTEPRPKEWIIVTMTALRVEEEFNGNVYLQVFDDETIKLMSNS